MCGATSQQKDLQAKQAAFYDTMTSQYKEVYGKQQGILDKLTSVFSPILAKGPNQHGFDDETRTNLETQSSESTARGYREATKALSEGRAARGGSDFIPSGVDAQLDANLAASAVAQDSEQEQKISLADMDAGRKNFVVAADALSGVAAQDNSSNFANSTTGAGSAAGETANQIAQASNSMWNSVIGGLSGVAGAAVGGWTTPKPKK